MQRTSQPMNQINMDARDPMGDPVRTCRACRDDQGAISVAVSIAVGSDGQYGACERDGHEHRAINRAGGHVTLVELCTPDWIPLREAFADEAGAVSLAMLAGLLLAVVPVGLLAMFLASLAGMIAGVA